MTKERKAELFDEELLQAASMFSDYGLYEWGRGHGLTNAEIKKEFNFSSEEIKSFKQQYKEDYNE